MEGLFLAALFGVSSVFLAWLARGGTQRSPRMLAASGRAALEFAGLWVICLVMNVAVGLLAILAVRGLTGGFLSVYLVNDISIIIVSALQAVMAQKWISSGRR
jgi:hypothetical protein